MDSHKEQFNISSEKKLQNQLNKYDLTPEEKTQVWQAVQQQEADIKAERQDYKENWNQRFEEEYDRLAAEQNPQVNLDYTPTPGVNNQQNHQQLLRRADANVRGNHEQAVKNIKVSANAKVNNVLDNARAEGRRKEPEPTQDFNRASQQQVPNRTLDR